MLRHATATAVTVRLTCQANRVQLAVQDNGRGITVQDQEDGPTFGLVGMRERVAQFGGDLAIHGTSGHGTTLVASFPWRQQRSGTSSVAEPPLKIEQLCGREFREEGEVGGRDSSL